MKETHVSVAYTVYLANAQSPTVRESLRVGLKIKLIDGWAEGETTEWPVDIIAEDIVVM
ncbi:hypothetical protein VPLG_00118 [Vibrio phage eugene 12A10]|uniref:hypothetical protein n=1 Tax=Vibrio phage eugene 12A10 TaxID=573172 RepID=UPI000351BB94|nr:hypothetical protein VPLG_00118 [Vibrio phage eugene 12A10]AGN51557.1 hypothetical protein VPLG_00118 [Vibrio phage eugene 12A10]